MNAPRPQDAASEDNLLANPGPARDMTAGMPDPSGYHPGGLNRAGTQGGRAVDPDAIGDANVDSNSSDNGLAIRAANLQAEAEKMAGQ